MPKRGDACQHRLSRGELQGLEGDLIVGGIVAVAVLDAIQQDQAVGINVDAGLRSAVLRNPCAGAQKCRETCQHASPSNL